MFGASRRGASLATRISERAEQVQDELLSRRRVLMGMGSAAAIGGGATMLAAPDAAQAAFTEVVYDKGGAVFNVKAYGATGNGEIDDTNAIKSAIAAAEEAAGGTVYFPQGNYLISSTLSVSRLGTHLIGAGRHGTVITAASSFRTGHMIELNQTEYCSVEHMTLSGGATPRTGGAGVRSYGINGVSGPKQNAAATRIHDLNLYQQFIGVQIDGEAWVNWVDTLYIYPLAPNGYGIYIDVTGYTGASQFISNVIVNGGSNESSQQPEAAIRVQHTGDYTLRSFSAVLCRNGLLVNPNENSPGYGIQAAFHEACLWDTMSNRCVAITPSEGVLARSFMFTNCWMAGAGTNECCYIGGAGEVMNMQLSDCVLYDAAGHGFFCDGNSNTKSISVDKCEAFGCGSGKAGFAFENTSEFAVRNCNAGNGSFGSNQSYGVRVMGGCDYYIITGNILRGNLTANLEEGSGAHKVVANNITT